MTVPGKKLKGLSLERLRTLSEVVREGNISGAAAGDATRQTQYSRQIKELEDYFGALLLDRSSLPHAATPFARELASLSEEFLAAIESMVARAGRERRRVALGAGEASLQALLIPIAAEFSQVFSAERMVLRNLTTRQVAAELTAQRLDLGLLDRGSVPGSLRCRQLPSWGMSLLLPRRMKHDGFNWERLTRVPIVLLNSRGRFRRHLSDLEEKRGGRLDVVMECTSYPQCLDAALKGDWATFVPQPLLKQFPKLSPRVAPLADLKDYRVSPTLAWHPAMLKHRPELERVRNWLLRRLTT